MGKERDGQMKVDNLSNRIVSIKEIFFNKDNNYFQAMVCML